MAQICVWSPRVPESARERSSEVKDIIDGREDVWSGRNSSRSLTGDGDVFCTRSRVISVILDE